MKPTNTNERLCFLKKPNLSEIIDGVLVGVADVDGKVVVAVHQGNETPHEIVHVLERTGLRSVTFKNTKNTKSKKNGSRTESKTKHAGVNIG